jgi:hypothetical protein
VSRAAIFSASAVTMTWLIEIFFRSANSRAFLQASSPGRAGSFGVEGRERQAMRRVDFAFR